MNSHVHPIFQKILNDWAPAKVEAPSLSAEILDEIDGAEETSGRDSQLTEWANRAQALEDALSDLIMLAAQHRGKAMTDSVARARRALAKAGVR